MGAPYQMVMIRHLESALTQSLAALTGKSFTAAAAELADWPAGTEPPYVWQQGFSVLEGPVLWLMAQKEFCESLGRQILEAAGVDSPSHEDVHSTWQEVVNQAMAAIASGITGEIAREVTLSRGEELASEPSGLDWIAFSVSEAGGQTGLVRIAWSPRLGELFQPADVPRDQTKAPVSEPPASRTFDVLLEMALPVCVSFGKTSLPIREVLKLNSGSIVELDRFVSDPVDVIVNGCVIARGEVVVVDGNYGVRISQLASREDRMRSGMHSV